LIPILPEEPPLELPVLMSMRPDDPADIASPEATVTSPLACALLELEPLTSFTDPPLWPELSPPAISTDPASASLLAPALREIEPDLPAAASPVAMVISPDAVPSEDPVAREIAPLPAPDAELPVDSLIMPDKPVCVAPVDNVMPPVPPEFEFSELADEMLTKPLVSPEPLLRETEPPVELALSPPCRLTEPPKPPFALPAEISISPLSPWDSPVVNSIDPELSSALPEEIVTGPLSPEEPESADEIVTVPDDEAVPDPLEIVTEPPVDD
jgi:hypothetical protein